jgi:acetyl-CoA acyltransferase 2
VDSVFWGNVQQSTTDCSYIARHVGLKAGVPQDRPMLTVNRLCGSGFEAVVQGAHSIIMGESEVCLTGGAESMSKAPYVLHGVRWGTPLGTNLPMVDSLWEGLTDLHINCTMSMTAENLAQQRWAAANAAGVFKHEIVPVEIKDKKKQLVKFEVDEHPRPTSDFATLQKLKALFKADGTVSAGNASGIADGAGAVIVASEAAVKKHNLKPLARVVSWASVGVPPEIMGYGPVPAFKLALQRAKMSLKDMDLIEVNEAFASQFVVVMNELKLDPAKTNVNGGAIAMGHPTGASGARILGHLALELKRKNLKHAIGGACIGGGQGIAVVLEGC